VVADMAKADTERIPSGFACGGEFSGWVYIMPASKYDVSEV
jgi:hypothetical protein